MHTRLFWSSNYFGKKKKPLLYGYKPNYGTFKERQPLLLDELRACIALLEQAKKKTPYKQPQLQRDYRKYAVLFMSLALVGLSGTGGMLTVMLMMMRYAHENILPELQKQLQSLYNRASALDHQIESNNPLLDTLLGELTRVDSLIQKIHDDEHELNDKWWGGLNRSSKHAYYDETVQIPDSVNNCVEWNDSVGRQKLVDIFPEINQSPDTTDEPCWFSENNKTHPLQQCNDIANTICINDNKMQNLYGEDDAISTKVYKLQAANRALENEKTNLENTEIPQMQSRIDNPYSEPEPITNTIFAVVALLSIAGIIYAAYRFYHSRQAHHTDIESHGNSVQRFLSSVDQTEQARIAKLALRLGAQIQNNTTIDSLLNCFNQKVQALESQNKQRMGFFAGVKIENIAAGNHQFLTNEASRNITQTIFEHAGLMSKK